MRESLDSPTCPSPLLARLVRLDVTLAWLSSFQSSSDTLQEGSLLPSIRHGSERSSRKGYAMRIRPDVIAGLRSLFKDGATYSGLLRFILKQLPEEEADMLVIQHYLMEAFSVPFFCGVKKNVGSTGNDDYYATINTWLIPRILSTRSTWMGIDHAEQAGAWWKTQKVTDPAQFPRGKPSWLSSASWESLSPVEQEKVAAAATSCAVLSEEVLLLSRLAERLQRRISELESQGS